MHVVECNIENFHPKKTIVNRGAAEVDNGFRGVKIFNVTLNYMHYLLYYTECFIQIHITVNRARINSAQSLFFVIPPVVKQCWLLLRRRAWLHYSAGSSVFYQMFLDESDSSNLHESIILKIVTSFYICTYMWLYFCFVKKISSCNIQSWCVLQQ